MSWGKRAGAIAVAAVAIAACAHAPVPDSQRPECENHGAFLEFEPDGGVRVPPERCDPSCSRCHERPASADAGIPRNGILREPQLTYPLNPLHYVPAGDFFTPPECTVDGGRPGCT